MKPEQQFNFDDDSEAGSLSDLTADQQELLLGILDRFMADWETGVAVDEESILRQHPQFASILRGHFENIRMLHGAAQQLDQRPDAISGSSDSAGNRRIGEFRIRREIGRGGMGIVYEAEQETLGRSVALKVLPFAAVLDQRQVARFKREAQTAGQLNHPHIVPVHAVGCERGVHFYSMRLIEGQSLDVVLSELRTEFDISRTETFRTSTPSTGPIDTTNEASAAPAYAPSTWNRFSTNGTHESKDYIRSVVELGVQAASALQHAHEYGVVHRDIKPSNLLLDDGGQLWVTDFGLAHIQSDVELTQTGNVIGTLRYMSPEQAAGSTVVDQRADVYSLGITLYELLTLQPAFAGENRASLAEQIANHDPVSARRLNPSISIDLETILLKSTAKLREDRYCTAAELQNDLQRYLDGRPTLARRPTLLDRATKWSMRHRALVATVCSVLFVALIGSIVAALMVTAEQHRTHTALQAKQQEFQRATKYFEHAQQVVDSLAIDTAQQLSRIAGTDPVRRQLLEKARSYYVAFCEDAEREFHRANDKALTETLAATHHRLGRINHHMGIYQDAEGSYRRALELYRDLHQHAPAARFAHRITTNLNGLGLALFHQGEVSEAETHFRAAITAHRKMATSAVATARQHCELASVFVNLAAVCDRNGQTARSIELVESARQQCLTAIELDATDESSRHRLAWCLHNLSYMLRNDNPQLATQYSQQAIDVQQELLNQHPDATVLQSELALSYSNYGALQSRQGDHDAATDSFRSAVRLGKKVVARVPNIEIYRRELVVALNYLGTCLKRANQLREADNRFTEARELVEREFTNGSATLRTRATLAGICNNQGMIAHLRGQHNLAARRYAEAIEYLEVVKSEQLGPEHESILATARQNLKKLQQQETATIQHTMSIVHSRPPRAEQP